MKKDYAKKALSNFPMELLILDCSGKIIHEDFVENEMSFRQFYDDLYFPDGTVFFVRVVSDGREVFWRKKGVSNKIVKRKKFTDETSKKIGL